MTDAALEHYTKEAEPSTRDMHALLSEYFAHGCFTATAASFAREAAAEANESSAMDVDSAAGLERAELKAQLMRGDVAAAANLIAASHGAALQKDTHARFLLHSQLFVELVRLGDSSAALRFAQEELAQYATHSQKYLDLLQDVVALIAYTDPYSSPLAHLLSQQRREEVATYLNSFLLEQQHLAPTTSLERIVQQVTLVRDVLAEPLSAKDKKASSANAPNGSPSKTSVFPKWDLALFMEQSISS